MKILLIEDNKEIAKNIQDYLKLDGHIVAWSGRGDDGLTSGLWYDFDVILLDLSLPWKDGIDVCKQIRQKKEVPIIMITARESVDQKVAWLESGANDYLVKPFDMRELVARIQAVTRNSFLSQEKTFQDITLDFASRKFLKKWKKITVTQKEFLILEYIYKHAPYVVSRTDVIHHVWWGEDELFSADGKLDVYISNLRSKFGKQIIETIKWVGYKWGFDIF